MKRLSRTGIEYGDYGWNFYPGCLHKPAGICPVDRCWAESMSKRQKQYFYEPHLIPELLLAPLRVKKPSVILVNFMGDLFGDWVNPNMIIDEGTGLEADRYIGMSLKEYVFDIILECPQHTFLFLTKAPWNLAKWGQFPDNAWVGATVWDNESYFHTLYGVGLSQVEAKHKWLSIEPLLGEIHARPYEFEKKGIEWVVMGGQTRPDKMPKIEWVEEIIMAAGGAGMVPVWLKNNLKPLIEKHNKAACDECEAGDPCDYCGAVMKFRQELPLWERRRVSPLKS